MISSFLVSMYIFYIDVEIKMEPSVEEITDCEGNLKLGNFFYFKFYCKHHCPLSSADLVSCVCFFFLEMDQESQTEPTNSDNSAAGITLILQTALIVSQISS